ncbi:cdkn1a interacting zinc finger protein 1b isoform X2 [Entelurus aequoreus]|uniref:cdkn1a interacting zinc finger protein 1b isoform X2 n=1 Tax=Entelurus aequoreus TaxID=161455 RepID=UPI002B1D2F1F|nr:cdkn1a interacting zinc finger protein 1b isoform X2 [Entelurus aequoreus]
MRKSHKKNNRAAGDAGLANRSQPSGSHDHPGNGVPPSDQQRAAELGDANRTAELHSAGSLKVTIQQSSDSREFPQKDATDDRPHCHVCGVTCPSWQVFEEHMAGSDHMTKVKEITRSITLMSRRGRWCDTCQTHYSGDVILHRRSKQHKVCKRESRPFCAACRRHFKSPRKLVEHMKCAAHKRQVQETLEEEEELITVDAIGCFEEEVKQEVPHPDRKSLQSAHFFPLIRVAGLVGKPRLPAEAEADPVQL